MAKKRKNFSRSSNKNDNTGRFAAIGSLLSPVVIGRIAGIGLAGLVGLILIYFVHQTQIVNKQAQELKQLSAQRAELTAKSVEAAVKNIQFELAALAQKTMLVSALKNNHTQQLEIYKKQFQQQLATIESVTFFAIGQARHNAEAHPPVRFADLELIRYAEERKPVEPEAVKVGDKWFITFVQPIPADASVPVVGTVLVNVRSDVLIKAITQSNIGMGDITLLQTFNNARGQVIVAYENPGIAEAESANVPGTPWQINFAPTERMRLLIDSNSGIILSILGVVLVLLLALFIWIGQIIGYRYQRIKGRGKRSTWQTITAVASAVDVDDYSEALHAKTDILDVDIEEEDAELLGLQEGGETSTAETAKQPAEKTAAAEDKVKIEVPDVVFRAYDIRGKYGSEITEDFALLLGRALGSEALDLGESTLIIARDARVHSPKLTEYLVRGVLSTGCHVLNIGTVPTPLMYFATETLEDTSSGVMVTASHNAADKNGFKVVMNGKCRAEKDIKAIRKRIMSANFYTGQGDETRRDIVPSYIDRIFSDVALAGTISIVIDAGNAVPGMVAPRLFEELGCQVTPLFCDVDGSFPNHQPDTSVAENLQALIKRVKEMKADLGVAFDGDGDRLAVVTPSGKIIWPDRLLMLFATDILSRNPGADVVFDVKSTRHLSSCIAEVGGRPIMWKTGHSPMKAKMVETGALVGGEYSGHIFFKERWYGFDDGLYAAARLIEIISLLGMPLDEIFSQFRETPSTPEIRVPVAEEKKFEIVQLLAARGDFGSGKMTTLDGVRVDYSNGWGLVRASNTSADLTMRFEADDENALHQLKSLFVQQLRAIDSSININWNT